MEDCSPYFTFHFECRRKASINGKRKDMIYREWKNKGQYFNTSNQQEEFLYAANIVSSF